MTANGKASWWPRMGPAILDLRLTPVAIVEVFSGSIHVTLQLDWETPVREFHPMKRAQFFAFMDVSKDLG
jgi:hypothetical protein